LLSNEERKKRAEKITQEFMNEKNNL
jgi:hypothetical protein